MREILFRGKRKDNGEWVYWNCYGDFCRESGKRTKVIITRASGESYYYHPYQITSMIRPETIGQYTGLKDKNGKRIFEGDIFKFPDEVWKSYYTSCGTEYDSYEVENYGVLGFNKDMGCFDFVKYKYNENSVEADLHDNHEIEFSDFVSSLEVIGNIHDNTELLEEI